MKNGKPNLVFNENAAKIIRLKDLLMKLEII